MGWGRQIFLEFSEKVEYGQHPSELRQ